MLSCVSHDLSDYRGQVSNMQLCETNTLFPRQGILVDRCPRGGTLLASASCRLLGLEHMEASSKDMAGQQDTQFASSIGEPVCRVVSATHIAGSSVLPLRQSSGNTVAGHSDSHGPQAESWEGRPLIN